VSALRQKWTFSNTPEVEIPASPKKRFKSPRQVRGSYPFTFQVTNLLHFPHSELSAADNRGAHAEAFPAWAEIAPVRLTVPFGF
jgi:hypothetical protein